MIVNSTEVQNKFGKYLKLAEHEDIIITRNGKKVARLVKYYENDDFIIREGSSAYSHEGMKVTYDEFLQIARESKNRYEYIDGQIYLLASPKFKHQKILINLSARLFNWFHDKDCTPLSSPLDVTLYKNEEPNVIQPDLLVICDQDNIDENDTYTGTPTLVIEILSESTRNRDFIKKLDIYMQGGVSEYWIVNHFSGEVHIYSFQDKEIRTSITYKNGETAESPVFPGLRIKLEDIFN